MLRAEDDSSLTDSLTASSVLQSAAVPDVTTDILHSLFGIY